MIDEQARLKDLSHLAEGSALRRHGKASKYDRHYRCDGC